MRINDPGPVEGQGDRITELWAWTAISAEHNAEGIIALETPGGGGLPLVGTVRQLVEQVEPVVRRLAEQSGATVQLRRFVPAEEE